MRGLFKQKKGKETREVSAQSQASSSRDPFLGMSSSERGIHAWTQFLCQINKECCETVWEPIVSLEIQI